MKRNQALLGDLAIETQNLSKYYGKACALRSLNMSVARNEIVGFLGPNGAGKTTTIKVLLGLMKSFEGEATILGYDIRKESLAIRQKIGYLPQSPSFHEYMNVREVLGFALGFYKYIHRSSYQERISNALRMVGLEKKSNQIVSTLSGGEKQRLGIAQAQIHSPELLILDEPAANLDPQGRHDVLDILAGLKKQTTVFFCTHIIDDVQRVGDSVVILDQGRLIAQTRIFDLLSGGRRNAYFCVTAGERVSARESFANIPWIEKIDCSMQDGNIRWDIQVGAREGNTDSQGNVLLQRFLNENLEIVEFGRKRRTLEDAFLEIVSNGSRDE